MEMESPKWARRQHVQRFEITSNHHTCRRGRKYMDCERNAPRIKSTERCAKRTHRILEMASLLKQTKKSHRTGCERYPVVCRPHVASSLEDLLTSRQLLSDHAGSGYHCEAPVVQLLCLHFLEFFPIRGLEAKWVEAQIS